MIIKITSLFISLLLIFCITIPATASTNANNFKNQVNEMVLEPLRPSYWNENFIKSIDNAVKGKKSNYDQLLAAYNYIVNDQTLKQNYNCVGYAVELQCAFEVIGFRTYHMRGATKAQGGGWTEHSWVGVDVGNNLYYFDANLPGKYGTDSKKCFAIPYKNAPLYNKEAWIEQFEISPLSDGGASWVLTQSNGIPDSVSKRKPYRATPDKVYSGYYDKGGAYWDLIWFNPDGTEGRDTTPVLVTDKEGNQFVCYPDGMRETYAEYQSNIKNKALEEHQAKQEDAKKRAEEEYQRRLAEQDKRREQILQERENESPEERQARQDAVRKATQEARDNKAD